MNRTNKTLTVLAILLSLTGQAWAVIRTSTADGNLSAGATWVGGVAPVNGDQIVLLHNVTVDADITLGYACPTTPTTTPTFGNTGATPTNLATGTYRVAYAWVDAGGNVSNLNFTEATLAVTNGVTQPKVTIPALPTGVSSANIYLSAGAAYTTRLYKTGVTTTTTELVDALWMDGTDTYANATQWSIYEAVAIRYSSSANGKTLTVGEDVTLTIRGDIWSDSNSSATQQTFAMSPGSETIIHPPNGQQYRWYANANGYSIVGNGTEAKPCTFRTNKTDGGLSFYNNTVNFRNVGVGSCTWTNFEDCSTSSNSLTSRYDAGTTAISITDCNFNRCNYSFAGMNNYDGAFTFHRNVFTNSVSVVPAAGFTACFGLTLVHSGTPTQVRSIDLCGFDTGLSMGTAKHIRVTNSYIGGSKIYTTAATIWTSEDHFSGNMLYAEFGLQSFANNPIKNLYFVNLKTDNPHFCNGLTTVYGCVFEAPHAGNLGTGDICFGGTVSYCLVLPGGNGNGTGKLKNGGGSVRHNTCYGRTEDAMVDLNEASAATSAGDVPACNSNLVWCEVAGVASCKFIYSHSTAAQATDTVTESICNAGWNLTSATCYYNTSTSQAGVVGYKDIEISHASPYPNSQVGEGNISLTADPFVDRTRNLAKWGETLHGTDGTYAAAAAVAAEDPSLIAELLTWVKDGFKVTGSQGLLLKDAGDDGVTIGAMEYQAAGGGGPAAFLIPLGITKLDYSRLPKAMRPVETQFTLAP
jgi:hypothetical protein